jgi:hypothetical protein
MKKIIFVAVVIALAMGVNRSLFGFLWVGTWDICDVFNEFPLFFFTGLLITIYYDYKKTK